MIGGWNGNRPTLLGILNHLIAIFSSRRVRHNVEDDGVQAWRPWWHGKHVAGSWRVEVQS